MHEKKRDRKYRSHATVSCLRCDCCGKNETKTKYKRSKGHQTGVDNHYPVHFAPVALCRTVVGENRNAINKAEKQANKRITQNGYIVLTQHQQPLYCNIENKGKIPHRLPTKTPIQSTTKPLLSAIPVIKKIHLNALQKYIASATFANSPDIQPTTPL